MSVDRIPRKHKPILEFRGEYRWLSNFEACEVRYEGKTYPSTEHAYMAAKTLDESIREHIRLLNHPRDARNFGRTIPLRDDWENLKYGAMLIVNRRKYFDNPALGDKLLATGDAFLCEGNTWGDRYWGVDPVGSYAGQNNLGRILMFIRNELREYRYEEEGRDTEYQQLGS